MLKPCKFGGSGDVGDSCKLVNSGWFWEMEMVILVNLVDLVILATPVASCDSRISVESSEYGDSVEFWNSAEFCDSDKSGDSCTAVVMRNMMIFVN